MVLWVKLLWTWPSSAGLCFAQNATAFPSGDHTANPLPPASNENGVQEARAAAALNHPNIVSLFDVGTIVSSVYPVKRGCVRGGAVFASGAWVQEDRAGCGYVRRRRSMSCCRNDRSIASCGR